MYLKDGTILQGGKYRIVRFINSGGFGCTYEADHAMLGKRVAIKEFFVKDFCNRDAVTSRISVGTLSKKDLVDKLRKKFVEEAQAVYDMRHANIVRVTDIFEENGTAYYVMEYIDGKSLADLVKECGYLQEDEALRYIRQVAAALEYVHGLDRLHLDVKPGNIMLDAKGNALLIDFGASKHYDSETGENTSTLMGVNTPGYAPVEQSTQSFTQFNPATDIYALGATLYKLLTGVTPPDAVSLMCGKAQLEPIPATVTAPTRDAVSAAMRPADHARPQTIAEFLDLLDRKKPDPKTGVVDVVGENTALDDKKDIKQTSGPKASIKPRPEPQPGPAPEPEIGRGSNNKLGLVLGIVAGLVLAVALFFAIPWGGGQAPVDPTDSVAAVASDTAGQNPGVILPPNVIDELRGGKDDKPAVAEKEDETTAGAQVRQGEQPGEREERAAAETKPENKPEQRDERKAETPVSAPAPEPKPEVVQVSTPTPAPAPVAKPTTGSANGHGWVDLGLPSGLKWATCNVGASSASAYGDYYAWGETRTKNEYWSDNSETDGKSGIGDIGGTSRDVARQKWGYPWRMPSQKEFQELIDNCDWSWTTQGGKNGYKVTSKSNGNSIFLPAAGYRFGDTLGSDGSIGYYWSSTPCGSYSDQRLRFNSGGHVVGWGSRSYGHSVRPVSE